MFTRKPSWAITAGKALFFAGVLYKIARMFMKSAGKPAVTKRRRPETDQIRRSLRTLLKNIERRR